MRPVVLVVLDGWGLAPPGPGNAITQAELPFYQFLWQAFPHTKLEAAGTAVGLPEGEDGNTEVGHINLGAGYIVYQDLPRINLSIADGSFFKNQAFLGAINHVRKYESKLHLLGLIGSGGVHANNEHLFALLELCKEQGFGRVFLHLITDGRDSPPKSSIIYLEQIKAYLKSLGFGEIATIMGRYYAMDRDLRWERTKLAYEALTLGQGEKGEDPVKLVKAFYRQGITDEFIRPSVIVKNGEPVGLIKAQDAVIFFNYRVDRPRQLTKAFVLDHFEKEANSIDFDPYTVKYYKKHRVELASLPKPFKRGKKIPQLYFVTMTEYSSKIQVSAIAFPPTVVAHPLGEAISEAGLFQLRMAESEKERFVTYYFNGQRESPFLNEERLIIPSPRVPTYDLAPAMSSFELTKAFLVNLKRRKYDFILVNFACPDMVAHTGVLSATIKACEAVDKCLAKMVPAVLEVGGTIFITGDHGNAEELINPETGEIDTEHSTFPVPFIAVNKYLEGKGITLAPGILADVAPTILEWLNIQKPKEMTGRNLLKNIV